MSKKGDKKNMDKVERIFASDKYALNPVSQGWKKEVKEVEKKIEKVLKEKNIKPDPNRAKEDIKKATAPYTQSHNKDSTKLKIS